MTELLKLVHFYSCPPVVHRGGRVTAPAASGWTWAVFPPTINGTIWPPLSWCPAELFSDIWLQSALHPRQSKHRLSQSTGKSYSYQTLIILTIMEPQEIFGLSLSEDCPHEKLQQQFEVL